MKTLENEIFGDASILAARYTAQFIINCYCREIAGPEGLIIINDQRIEIEKQWAGMTNEEPDCLLTLDLPWANKKIVCGIDAPSLTYNYKFATDFFVIEHSTDQDTGLGRLEPSSLRVLAWDNLAKLIVQELSERYGIAHQSELLEQIKDSKAVLERILCFQEKEGLFNGAVFSGMMASEAGLVFGHTFHPAPKSRQGFNEYELALYSPEFCPAFPLHYFAVDPQHLKVLALESVDLTQFFSQIKASANISNPTDWPLIPCHPWQARYLSGLPEITEAIKARKIIDLGQAGSTYTPTSSVRTLLSDNFPYFVKASLSLRITNSVRKNAFYEIESAVALSKILRPITPMLSQQHPGFSVLLEPVAMTVDLTEERLENRLSIQGHFGVIFRDAVKPGLEGEAMVLAAALFGDDVTGLSNTALPIRHMSDTQPEPDHPKAATRWFSQYIHHLIPPVLSAFFDHGIAFEPHLQNVLVTLQNHSVRGITLRDLEGTKLNRLHWPDTDLPCMSDRARESMCHNQEKAWRRVVYCLFVNNLCQAVFHCSCDGTPESLLWALVREELELYMTQDTSALCHQLVGALLTDESIPCKANIITRFFQQADGNAHYVSVPNPLRSELIVEPGIAAALDEVPA
ncbi:MAG: IucA/IucC family protein [Exilibacterium sp.]